MYRNDDDICNPLQFGKKKDLKNAQCEHFGLNLAVDDVINTEGLLPVKTKSIPASPPNVHE